MFWIFLALFVGAMSIGGSFFIPNQYPSFLRWIVRVGGSGVAIFLIAATSFIYIGQDERGHRHRVYFGDDLPVGKFIALAGQKGPQAEIMAPGFHFELFLNVLYDVTKHPVIEIPEGHYGYMVARDGTPLLPNQTYADAFGSEHAQKMMNDAVYFLFQNGQKGPQTSVLTPGKYPLNHFLWSVSKDQATDVPVGFVGVIKSNVHSYIDFGNLKAKKPNDCSPTRTTAGEGDALAVPLVPVGCIGVWDKALNPGRYYINKHAYQVTLVETRVQTWEYKGGYTRRRIDLTVSQSGEITQSPSVDTVTVPKDAADGAVEVKVEGWTVPVELRVLVQVTPENAPFVIASVGGLQEIEDRILTPAIRSILRNVGGGQLNDVPTLIMDKNGNPVLDEKTASPVYKKANRPTRVLDFIENRELLESNVETLVKPEGRKAGVEIKEIRFGDPVIPPELLVARQREQLAQQLSAAYEQEQTAQTKRIATEQARATANKQPQLVEAEIEVRRSIQFAMARKNEGQGERDKLSLIAEGQKQQASVLGEERVVELRKFELVVNRLLDLFKTNPDILTAALSNAQKFVPNIVVGGSGEGAGAGGLIAALLGQSLSNMSPAQAPKAPNK